MIRTVFAAAAAAAVVLSVGVAIAQQDVIKERKTLMKENGDTAKLAADIIKGAKPFDMAAVHKIFTEFQDVAAKMPSLFPDSSKSEVGSPSADDFSPTAKVWDDMADFKARFERFAADAKEADATVKDLDGFKAAMAKIGKTDCGGCHQIYRAKKS